MRLPIAVAPCLLLVALACHQAPAPGSAPAPEARSASPGFSGERAWRDLTALTEIGPRAAGSEGAERARDYLLTELEKLGVEVVEQRFSLGGTDDAPDLTVVNLIATIPGTSKDLIILAAPYDTARRDSFVFVGANDGGSGPALLLELGRALKARPLPYTVQLLFLDGEAPGAMPGVDPDVRSWLGSDGFAWRLVEGGRVARVRLIVFFDRVADAELRIARDLHSYRNYREEFWRAAARLGYTEAFPPALHFETLEASHRPFIAKNVRRVVAITDSAYGGDTAPGIYAFTEDDTLARCSAESLEIVGRVALEALATISRRLEKIDRFSEVPLPESEESPAEPAPDPATAEEPATQEEPSTAEEPATAEASVAPEEAMSGEPSTSAEPVPESDESSDAGAGATGAEPVAP